MKAGELIDDAQLSAPSKLSVRQELKRHKELNINRMSSWAIIWHLTRKHRTGLLITSNIILIVYLVTSKLHLS